jgi:hypothetical protein
MALWTLSCRKGAAAVDSRRRKHSPRIGRIVFLCLAVHPAVAAANNFEDCVDSAKQNNNETAADNYSAYKCEGTIAEKLSARPDECPGGSKPAVDRLQRGRVMRQLEDGLYLRLSWKVEKCSGVCETTSYVSKDATHLCEVRIYNGNGQTSERVAEQAPGSGSRPSSVESRSRRHGATSSHRFAQPGHSPPPMPEWPPEARRFEGFGMPSCNCGRDYYSNDDYYYYYYSR